MPNPNEKDLFREAARILIRLNERPDDPQAVADRDAFLAQGQAQKDAFEQAWRAFKVGAHKPATKLPMIIGFLVATAIGGYLAYNPVRIALLADFTSDARSIEVALASGDVAYLDASTAIQDDTQEETRRVRLLSGASFFDVDTTGQSFVVEAGPVAAEALGTAFEVTRFDNSILVAVAEGRVEVRVADQEWILLEGERLTWSEHVGTQVDDIPVTDVATWREERFVTDGMTFGEVVEVLDRRIPGRVVVMGDDLRSDRMTGALDLNDPKNALDVLAGARSATLYSIPSVLTVIRPKK
ncbi:MAG: FecR domain-containing protein [Pseudomonadota bacterium]